MRFVFYFIYYLFVIPFFLILLLITVTSVFRLSLGNTPTEYQSGLFFICLFIASFLAYSLLEFLLPRFIPQRDEIELFRKRLLKAIADGRFPLERSEQLYTFCKQIGLEWSLAKKSLQWEVNRIVRKNKQHFTADDLTRLKWMFDVGFVPNNRLRNGVIAASVVVAIPLLIFGSQIAAPKPSLSTSYISPSIDSIPTAMQVLAPSLTPSFESASPSQTPEFIPIGPTFIGITETASPQPAEPAEPAVDDIVYRVTGQNIGNTISGSYGARYTADGWFLRLDIQAENRGKSPAVTMRFEDMILSDSQGRTFAAKSVDSIAGYCSPSSRYQLNPEAVQDCAIVFDLPNSANGLTFTIGDMVIDLGL